MLVRRLVIFVAGSGCIFGVLPSVSAVGEGAVPSTVLETQQESAIRANIAAFCAKCPEYLGEPIRTLRQTVMGQKDSLTLRAEDAYVVNETVSFGIDSLTGTVIRCDVSRLDTARPPAPPDDTSIPFTEDYAFDAAKGFLRAFELPLDKSRYESHRRNDGPNVIVFQTFVTHRSIRVYGLSSRVEVSLLSGKVQKASRAVLFEPPAEPVKVLPPCDAVSKADMWLRKNIINIHATSAKITVDDCNSVKKVIAARDRLTSRNYGGMEGRFEYCWEIPCEYSEGASMFTNAHTWKGEIRVSCTSGEVLDFG